MGAWYCTREDVKSALDSKETARDDAQVDAVIAASSRSVEALCHRVFYPHVATKYFDWPNAQYARSYRLWLDANELISVTTLTSGGTAITAPNYILYPQAYGPPYNRIELNLGTNAAFDGGDTNQQSIAITGLYGYTNDETTAGTTAEALDASETGVDVGNGAPIGVGSVIRIDSERMIVQGREMITTGLTLNANLDGQKNAETLALTGMGTLNVGEVILIDAERMLVTTVAGSTAIVKRAWDGSTLAAHTSTATIYASRRLTVQRGALGTTAATHSDAASILLWLPPDDVAELTLAESVVGIQRRTSGFGTQVGGGSNQRRPIGGDLEDLRCRVKAARGRSVRVRAV